MIGNGKGGITAAGRTQIKEFSIVLAANVGLTTIATATGKPCLIKSVVLHADAAQTADLTSIAINGGASQAVEFIPAASAIQANLDAENKQVGSSLVARLPVGSTIVATPVGTGATALDLTLTIEYEACEPGGYLA